MIITTTRDISVHNYFMQNISLSRVPSHKYLGVTVESKLSWSNHIANISAKAAKTLGLIKRTLYPCSPMVKVNAYKALVRPKLEYAVPIWSPHSSK